MRFKKYKLIFLGAIIILFTFLFSGYFVDCGCGCCPGYERLGGSYITIFILDLIKAKPSPESCAFVGCLIGGRLPIFIDLYLFGLILLIIGVLKQKKFTKKN